MRKNRWIVFCLAGCLMLSLCACTDTNEPAESDTSGDVQYDYQLVAGEETQVFDQTFDEMVTVTVDPASTKDGGLDLRSAILFDNCTFNGGLTIVGDYHAMVSLGEGCSFGDGAVVTFREATSGATKEMTLEDNFVKLFVSCEGVTVETDFSMGVVTGGPEFDFNGTVYNKEELAPDTAFLGVYSICEGDTITYTKLALGEDDSVTVLD